MPKKHLISVLSATVFAIVSIILFQVISLAVISGYGETAKEAFALASSRQFGKTLIIIIVCAIIYLVSCFSNPKYIKIIFIVCGVISCIVGGYICIGTSIHFSGSPEIQAFAAPAVRLLSFSYGIAFPLLYALLCVLACGNDLKGNVVNQVISCACFVVLYTLIVNIASRLVGNISMSITVSACTAVAVTLFPSLNLDNIRAQMKKKIKL